MNWIALWMDHLELPGKILGALVAMGALWAMLLTAYRKMFVNRIERFEKRLEYWGKKLEKGILNQILTRRLLLDRESSSAFCEFDEKGGCVWTSRLFRKTTGLDSDEVRGNGWLLGVHHSEIEAVSVAWSACVSQGRGFERTVTFTDREGNTCAMKVFSYPLINDDSGEIISYFAHAIK